MSDNHRFVQLGFVIDGCEQQTVIRFEFSGRYIAQVVGLYELLQEQTGRRGLGRGGQVR